MFHRVTIRVADLGAAERFYDTVLTTLGIERRGSRMRGAGAIDHLWIRVADVAASKDFYVDVAAHAGFRLAHDAPARARFEGDPGGSFTLLAGRPTENLHMTFRGGVTGARLDPDGNRVEIVS